MDKTKLGENMFRPHKHLSGPVINHKTNGKVDKLIFIFHGWGADGANLIDIGYSFSVLFPEAEIHLPNGIEKCPECPSGFQWFNLASRDPQEMYKEAERAAILVEEYIKETAEHANISWENIVLVGFSQGAMLSLHLALTRENLCSSVIGFSGYLVHCPTQIVSNPPAVILIHGEEDDIIPIDLMKQSHAALKARGVEVDGYCMENLAHGINQEGLELASQFIQNHFKNNEKE